MNSLEKQTTFTTTAGPECKHATGFFMTAEIWIFKKRYFVCSDCWTALTIKEYEATR